MVSFILKFLGSKNLRYVWVDFGSLFEINVLKTIYYLSAQTYRKKSQIFVYQMVSKNWFNLN